MFLKNINIFISSTFNDMQSERDFIRKYIVPKLKEQLAEYHISVQVTDLRWGIDTQNVDEQEREAKVLHVCLDAIQNSKPYFIALLGERYGWVPSVEHINNIKRTLTPKQQLALGDTSQSLSVTEMEILLGALGEHNLMPHSFFCFRRLDSYESMPKEKKSEYIDSMSSDEQIRNNAKRLVKLKTRITNECKRLGMDNNIIEYTAKWNENKKVNESENNHLTTGKFEGLESFGNQLYDLIYNDITSEFKAKRTEDNPRELEKEKFLSFISSHTVDFQGRKTMIEKVMKFFFDARKLSSLLNGETGYFLSGFSGCGKSAFFAILYQTLTKVSSHNSFYILAHAAGISPKSILVDEMIGNWCIQMRETLGDNSPESSNEEGYSYKNRNMMLSTFKQLLTRIQARGLFPIVLIDSLDSFEDNQLLQDFNFLPKDVPFFCTTLPGYAEKIVEKHSLYICHNMDELSIDDAHLIIQSVLKKNFKELSLALQEKLLRITQKDGTPAYISPLWLRMALDILMELGEEDFNKIHKIQQLRENAKIENYLSHIIEELPGDSNQLFNYFIELTCHYFNAELTKQGLTYIAVSQYGIKEDDIAELLGNKWNPLDFTSLRYWMRNLIQCNNKDHRWFFTHSVLRQTVIDKNSILLEQCQNSLLELLVKNLSENEKEPPQELIHQIINTQNYVLLHYHLGKLYHHFINSFIREFDNNKDRTLLFMRLYINHYYIEDSELISDVEHELFETGNNMESSTYTKTALELFSYHLSLFTNNDFAKSQETYEYYFLAQQAKSYYIEYMDADELYLSFFNPLISVYKQMKYQYSDNLPFTLSYSFFSYWHTYIYKLRTICRYDNNFHEQYIKNISEYIEERALWCIHNKRPKCIFENMENLINDRFQISNDEKISLMQLMHRMVLRTINTIDRNTKDYEIIIRATYELIDSYVNLFNSKDVVLETELMKYLSYSPQPVHEEKKTSIYEEQIPNDLPEEKTISIVLSSTPTADEEEEWITIDLNSTNLDPDSFVKKITIPHNNDEEDDYIMLNDISETTSEAQIKILESSLDEFLKKEKHNYNQSEEDIQKELKAKVQTYRCLILLYLQTEQAAKSYNLINQLSKILSNFIIDMGDNYALDNHASEEIIKYGKWLAQIGQREEQLKQAEAITEALFHSYYHHENGSSQRRVFNYLINLYDEYGMVDKKISLLQQMYEISIRNHIERMYRAWDFYFPDLSYVRSIFLNLFKALHSARRIKDAVISLERWINICHLQYLDVEDTYGYEDLDNAYDLLASLYDGTPSLVEGMKERHSIFLKDPLIMVSLDDKWGYINHEGNVAIPLIYSRVWKAEPDCLSVCRDGKWGYIDLQGKELSFLGNYNFQLDCAIPIKHNWGRISIDNRWAEFHLDSHQLDLFLPIKVNCDRYHDITDGLTKVNVKIGNNYRQDFLLHDGETLLFRGTKHSVKTPNKGVIIADWYNYDEEDNDGHHTAIYNMQGKELTAEGRYVDILAFGRQDITAAYSTDNRAGYVNRNGKEISSFEYRRCRPFSSGRGAVCKEGTYKYGRWGFINELGEEVVQPQYIDVGDFHEGLAWICLDNHTQKGFGWRGGKFGFINLHGEMIIPTIYDDVSSFYEGRALVWKNERAMYINHKGDVIG